MSSILNVNIHSDRNRWKKLLHLWRLSKSSSLLVTQNLWSCKWPTNRRRKRKSTVVTILDSHNPLCLSDPYLPPVTSLTCSSLPYGITVLLVVFRLLSILYFLFIGICQVSNTQKRGSINQNTIPNSFGVVFISSSSIS